jgi:YD repeat-containing protein
MPLSKLVPLSRSIGLITRNIPAKWVRLVCLVAFFAFVLSTLPVRQDATAQGSRPRRPQGPPSRNLPNLDETRGSEPGTPRIMPPVPATQCRGRDEKCKKAKGRISSNLTGNQDRLLANFGIRSERDYARWLNSGIPALAMLANLIYLPARMISDFPDIPYRNSGGALAESAAMLANPRGETYGKAALRGPRKEYGYRSGRSIVTVQGGGVVTVNPSAYETSGTPDLAQVPVNSPSNTGHAPTSVDAPLDEITTSQSASCRWFGFPPFNGVKFSVKLKIGYTSSGARSLPSATIFKLSYSLDGGSNWTDAVSRMGFTGSQSGVFTLDLPLSQDLTQVQVRDVLIAGATIESFASVTATISNIRIEVETDTTAPVISNVAAGGITATSATITWNTNENSDSQVEYGHTQAYGQSTTLNPAPVTAHSQGLSGLTSGTLYHYRVKSKDAYGNLAVSDDFTFTTATDTTPPTVTSFSPAAGATNVNALANVTVTFSEAMTAATVNGSTVELRDSSNAMVSATVSYNAALLTATLNPTSSLAAGVTYTARVRGGGTDPRLKDVWGNALAADLTWTFTTRPPLTGELSMALIDPVNRIGAPGKDLLSRNCNWSLPLLSLPGRAGLDLGLTLSLNSLVYTRAGSAIYFDPDQGDLGPGFRLGFPEIRNAFTNTEAGAQSYLLSMPSGSRVEFRQTNTNVYESVDSSYMLLTHDPINSVFILRTTDGTQFRFEDVTGQGDYKCKQIKDRNGNFITIGYGSLAEIRTVTDTLGRVINFNYDSSNHLLSITQNWGGQTHTWATFAYGTRTIQTNFPGLTLNGTTNGAGESVLLRVGLADGSVYSFEYNTYAQVKTIRRWAPNNYNPVNFPGDYYERAYTTYGLPDNGSASQTDCPRATSRTDGAYDWHSSVTSFYEGDSHAWGQVTFPDGTKYKEFFATTGWQRGLTTLTENWTGGVNGVRKKWTTLQWTQDNTGVSYKLNPRVTETIVHDDANNQRRTEMIYTSFGLVREVKEYDADTTTLLRLTRTDYNLSAVYTSRRIIGLPSARYLYDGNNTLFSKVKYEYDLGGEFLAHQGPPIQHDTTNYGSGFVQGRGDLNRTLRCDVTDQDNPSKASKKEFGYNTSGSVIFTRDSLDHQASYSYDDSFSDGQNDRNTYAYPTTMTDPDQFSSYVKYNYYFGAVTWARDPKLAVMTRIYDAVGRIERITNAVNGAYTRYVYEPDQRRVETFTTINDLNPANEFRSVTFFDGHDRVKETRVDHPGSVGLYKAQLNVYDVMGRLAEQSNPTEVNSSGQPAGDDAAAGWVWRYQSYDWRGRPTVSTNQDVTTKSASYEGCGCSGGDVVTLMDEGTLVNEAIERRKQKIYHDVLGRVVKTEIYDWNNNVYTTVTQAYNALDQTTTITRRQGSAGASQVATFSYDGHGRLSALQLPNESAPSNFVYNADDTLQMVTDARAASSIFSYNNRHKVTGITYGVPSGVAATPNVTFGYDEAGNRTSMTDGLGSATYHYDVLSRMDWETRVFTGVGAFTINYTYNLAGQLTSVTDPNNDSVNYVYNSAGEFSAINGSAYAGVTQYASGLQFRAWGGLKALSYGNGMSLSNTYNSRLQLQQMEVKETVSSGSPSLMKTQYQYYPDGTLKYTQDLMDSRFDRAWTYDQVGRLSVAYTGQEADNYAGASVPVPQTGPYLHAHQYDVWNNLTSRTGRYWSQTTNFTATYNSQNQRQGWTYDAAGNLLNDTTNQHTYDAEGRNVSAGIWTQSFDGLGRTIKRSAPLNQTTYYLYSTPMGGKLLTELFGGGPGQPGQQPPPLGSKVRTYIHTGDVVIARQDKINGLNRVEWEHQDELTGSLATSRNGLSGAVIFGKTREPDPMGVDVGLSDPLVEPPLPEMGEIAFSLVDDNLFPGGKCTIDGAVAGCPYAEKLHETGAAVVAPSETLRYKKGSWETLKVNPDGSLYWDTVTGGGLKIKDSQGNVIDSIPKGAYQIWNNRGEAALYSEYMSSGAHMFYLDRSNVYKKPASPEEKFEIPWSEIGDAVKSAMIRPKCTDPIDCTPILMMGGIKIGPRWRARPVDCNVPCEYAAKQIQKQIGGEIKRIEPSGQARYLPPFRGQKDLLWEHHDVVVKGGRVYDIYTGYKGMAIDEYKKLWDFSDAIKFGF